MILVLPSENCHCDTTPQKCIILLSNMKLLSIRKILVLLERQTVKQQSNTETEATNYAQSDTLHCADA